MLNILGTELKKLNDIGRANVAEAVKRARRECGEMNGLDEEVQQLVALWIELSILIQIQEGRWSTMGIIDEKQMGNPKVFLEVVGNPPEYDLKVLLPAFVRDTEQEIN